MRDDDNDVEDATRTSAVEGVLGQILASLGSDGNPPPEKPAELHWTERARLCNFDKTASIDEHFPFYKDKSNKSRYGRLRPPAVMLDQYSTRVKKAKAVGQWRRLTHAQQLLLKAKYQELVAQQRQERELARRAEVQRLREERAAATKRRKEEEKAEKKRLREEKKAAEKPAKEAQAKAKRKARNAKSSEKRSKTRKEAKLVRDRKSVV